jgi:hypothetical protein
MSYIGLTRVGVFTGLTASMLSALLLISASSATGSATTDARAAIRCWRIPASSTGSPTVPISYGGGVPASSWCYYKPSSKPLTVTFSFANRSSPYPPSSAALEIHHHKTAFIGAAGFTSISVGFRRRGKYGYRFLSKTSTGDIVVSQIFGYLIVK